MDDRRTVNGLWIGSMLSPLELLTVRSFLANGYVFRLWAYDEIANIPGDLLNDPDFEVGDAAAILSRDRVFRYRFANAFGHGKGSYAGFSDIFRYRLLLEKGGLYVDMDVTCLKPIDAGSDYLFRYHHKYGCVGNIMQCPPGSDVMQWCYEKASREVNADNRRWELPIEILREGVHRYDLDDCIIRLSNDDSWPVVAGMISGRPSIPDAWCAIHWMNEEWRHLGLEKDRMLPGGLLDVMFDRYGVEVERVSGWEAVRLRTRLSRWYYALLSLGNLHRRIG